MNEKWKWCPYQGWRCFETIPCQDCKWAFVVVPDNPPQS